MRDLLKRWTGPSGLLILLGAIVWGVQLNFEVLVLAEKVATNKKAIEAHTMEAELWKRKISVLESQK